MIGRPACRVCHGLLVEWVAHTKGQLRSECGIHRTVEINIEPVTADADRIHQTLLVLRVDAVDKHLPHHLTAESDGAVR